MNNRAILIIKIAVAFSFIYPAVASLIAPTSWVGFIPDWTSYIISKESFLLLFSIFQIVLGVSILFLKKIFYPSITAAFILFSIVIFNIGTMDIVFRDISIGLIAIALAIMTR